MNEGLDTSLTVVLAKLEKRFGGRLRKQTECCGDLTITVEPEDWMRVLSFCRSARELAFDQLDCLLGDHLPERTGAPFEVVVHLLSHTHGHRLRVTTPLAEGQDLPTITGLWPSAGFDEREAWEMYGIVFAGHPDLRRLLTTEDFEGFPMRKDFPLRGTVGGRIRTDLRGKI
ncbi:MAG: NADH-quinone oxidoreductase subunit C [Actinobacteria bacterium]|nr:NADH-quinone oxidoreductase subunit C [Actinomycetota bacterium]